MRQNIFRFMSPLNIFEYYLLLYIYRVTRVLQPKLTEHVENTHRGMASATAK